MLNVLQIVGFLVSFGVGYAALGYAWYSNWAFGPVWRRLTGYDTARSLDTKGMLLTLGISVLFAMVSAFFINYLFFFGSLFFGLSLAITLLVAVVAWLAIGALPNASGVLYKGGSWKLFFIDEGFKLAVLVLYALIWYGWASGLFSGTSDIAA